MTILESTPLRSLFVSGNTRSSRGWEEGIARLHVGDRATLIIPPALAYGHRSPVKDIPPNATLFCGIELVDAREHTLGELIARPIEKDGPAATERMVKSLKPGLEKQYYVSEDGLNALRYQYLGKNRVPHAIAIFKINAEQFPNSATSTTVSPERT